MVIDVGKGNFPTKYEEVTKFVHAVIAEVQGFLDQPERWTCVSFLEMVWKVRYVKFWVTLCTRSFPDAKREEYAALQQFADAFMHNIFSDRSYLEWVEAVAGLDGRKEVKAAARQYRRLAEEAGVLLTSELRARIAELQARAVQEATQANQHIVDLEQHTRIFLTRTEAQRLLDAAPHLNSLLDDATGLITITPQNGSQVVEWVSDAALRTTLYRCATQSGEAMFGHASQHLRTRADIAQVLNQGSLTERSWGEWQEYFSGLPAGTILRFLRQAASTLKPRAVTEKKAWRKRLDQRRITVSDLRFGQRVIREQFAGEAQTQASFEQVLTLLTDLLKSFGFVKVEIAPWEGYAPDLYLVTLTSAQGVVDYIILDLFLREGKALGGRVDWLQVDHPRIAVLTLNLQPDIGWSTRNLESLGHELGHALQLLLNLSLLPHVSCDYSMFTVEVGSTLLELFMQSQEVRRAVGLPAPAKGPLVGEALWWNWVCMVSRVFWDAFSSPEPLTPVQLYELRLRAIKQHDAFDRPIIQLPAEFMAWPHWYGEYEALMLTYLYNQLVAYGLFMRIGTDTSLLRQIYEAGSLTLHTEGYIGLLQEKIGRVDLWVYARILDEVYN